MDLQENIEEKLHKRICFGKTTIDGYTVEYYNLLGGVFMVMNSPRRQNVYQFIPASEVLESLSTTYNELISQLEHR